MMGAVAKTVSGKIFYSTKILTTLKSGCGPLVALWQEETGMNSLRARQKEDRRRRIAASAKTLFQEKGYEQTTIESIAEAAGVSGVTVQDRKSVV